MGEIDDQDPFWQDVAEQDVSGVGGPDLIQRSDHAEIHQARKTTQEITRHRDGRLLVDRP